MSAHTPGPWRQEYEHIYAHKDGNNTHLIAEVFTGDDDARLIAAAPRMLEALERIDDILHRRMNGGAMGAPTIGECKQAMRAARDEARAILREIEGQSNG